MTEQNPYIFRIELEDFENKNRYAEYQSFTVEKQNLSIDLISMVTMETQAFLNKNNVMIMKRNFKQWWSTILPIQQNKQPPLFGLHYFWRYNPPLWSAMIVAQSLVYVL
jgi:hypothetical protein